MTLCQTHIPPLLTGVVALAWAIIAIACVSVMAVGALRATARLPRWLSVPLTGPAIAWHEICHALGCIVGGHRIQTIRLWGDARVEHAYDPSSLWQRMGCVLAGWSPVLISAALLMWLIPRIAVSDPILRTLGIYSLAVLALAMPLSRSDWIGALKSIWVVAPVATLLGLLLRPDGMALCAPWNALASPLTSISVTLIAVWVLATLIGKVGQ